jgi:hypothetical protein
MNRTLPYLILLALGITTPAAAQEISIQMPVFKEVVPNPTGRNGYEELVRAADLIRMNRRFLEAEANPAATLTEKRRVLADRQIRRALHLTREGLSKPVFSPRTTLGFSTGLPELNGFRSIALLLRFQQYVLLADGKVKEAVEVSRFCLLLGQAVQTDTLVSGLVGVSIGAIGVRGLAEHLDQFSAGDCALLFAVCREWLLQPSPVLRILEPEQRAMLTMVRELARLSQTSGPSGLKEVLGDESGDQAHKVLGTLVPDQVQALLAEAEQKIQARMRILLHELSQPVWQQNLETLEAAWKDDTSSSGAALGMLTVSYTGIRDTYTGEVARMRLLACHAAIRRYRWEHSRLPDTLDVLTLGELTIDPFTGEALEYEPRGSRYSLRSAGRKSSADDPDAANGRRPVTLDPP